MSFIAFSIAILIWINQHKQIYTLACCIFVFTFCFIFIPIHLSLLMQILYLESLIVLGCPLCIFNNKCIQFCVFDSRNSIIRISITIISKSSKKTQWPGHLNFNSTSQLINGISINLPKLFAYFNGTTIVLFLKIPLAPSVSVFPNKKVYTWKT